MTAGCEKATHPASWLVVVEVKDAPILTTVLNDLPLYLLVSSGERKYCQLKLAAIAGALLTFQLIKGSTALF